MRDSSLLLPNTNEDKQVVASMQCSSCNSTLKFLIYLHACCEYFMADWPTPVEGRATSNFVFLSVQVSFKLKPSTQVVHAQQSQEQKEGDSAQEIIILSHKEAFTTA